MHEVESRPVPPVTDPGIPTLPAVLRPGELSQHLQGVLPVQWGTLHEVRVGVLVHHPGSRCTLEMALRMTGGWHDLIGKVYSEDRLDVYLAMEQIKRAGFGPEEEYSIPDPIHFVSGLRLLLLEKVQGPLAQDLFLKGNERDRAVASGRCARWLARFHALAPKTGTVLDLNNHLICLERWSRRIGKLGEPVAGKAARLFSRLEAAASKLDGMEMSAGHASYGPAQIILGAGRTVTFDWDGYDVAHPGRDVARFMIALRRLALGRLRSIRALDAEAELFLKTYVDASHAGAVTDLPFYQAAVCLRLAKYNLSHQVSRWKEKLEAMLDEGIRISEGWS